MAKNKKETTYERFIRNKKRKKLFDQKYSEFILSEIILGLMEQEKISVRALAKQVGISPTIIQELRTGKKKNLTIKNLAAITSALGAEIKIHKGNAAFSLYE